MKGEIGDMTWVACESCIHSDSEIGGCDVEEEVFLSGITQDADTVFCGSYEEGNN